MTEASQDPFLVQLSAVAEANPNFALPITLITSAGVVTGTVVSRTEFFGTNPLSEKLREVIDSRGPDEAPDLERVDRTYHFLHLLRVRLFDHHSSGHHWIEIAGNSSAARINIAQVTGFFVGGPPDPEGQPPN